MLIDSHCHLYLKDLEKNLPEVLERAESAGVGLMVCVGIDLATSRKAVTLAETHPQVVAAVGVHPSEAGALPADYLRQLEELLQHPRVVAVGETGLDFYRNRTDPRQQRQVFREQITLARSMGKAFIFHNRRADAAVLEILREGGYTRGVAHCYSSDPAVAESFWELGLYISLAGNLTYGSGSLSAVAKRCPLDRIMVETDAPFLSPVPHRGKDNEPARLPVTVAFLSQLRQMSVETISRHTTENTQALFGLPLG